MATRLLDRTVATATLGTLLTTLTVAAPVSAQQASPAAQPQPASTVTLAGAPTEEAESPTDWQLIGGIAGLTVGAAFAVMGIYASVRVNDISDDAELDAYRARIPAGRNACEAARAGEQVSATGSPDPGHVADLCDEAESLEVLQGIAIPTAVVVGLAGWVLVGTSDTWCSIGDDMALTPWVGPEGGGIGFRARF